VAGRGSNYGATAKGGAFLVISQVPVPGVVRQYTVTRYPHRETMTDEVIGQRTAANITRFE